MSSYFLNKKRAVNLEEDVHNLESEIIELDKELSRIHENFKEKEVEVVRIKGETYSLEEFNRAIDESLTARLSKIQDLTELKRELETILEEDAFVKNFLRVVDLNRRKLQRLKNL